MGAGASRKAAVAMLMDKQATVVKLTFEEIDTDKNGKLSCEEILEALAKHFKEGISKAGIASVVAAFDTDGDGQLDRKEFDAVLHELRSQKAAGSPAELLKALAALNADVQAAPAEQLSADKLRALAVQLGQLKADAERMADAMEAKGAAKTEAGAKPASKANAAASVDTGVLAVMTPEAQAKAQARTVRLLESLAAKEKRVERPVLPNSKRRRSGQ